MVEVLVAITITALAGSILLLGITTSLQTTNEGLYSAIAQGLAEQLADEILGCRYMELGASGHQTILCPSPSEASTGTRELFDDIDDFNGFSSQPLVDSYGILLGKDDGTGGERDPACQAPLQLLENWRQEVDVYYVSESDFTTPLPSGTTSDWRAVEVQIVVDDPDRGPRVLATVKRVVTYVPPLTWD